MTGGLRRRLAHRSARARQAAARSAADGRAVGAEQRQGGHEPRERDGDDAGHDHASHASPGR